MYPHLNKISETQMTYDLKQSDPTICHLT
uniref:Uncharacterized protein n=1 Tax=Rhizophora mucronata TaxID=61149 RepID=A0A2P2PRD7_RHIMU